ncbi:MULTISPECIES: hypothetical protein [Staphylococcus]|uniref:hypothetical protein n=1 Tax=Staphylococcus TaxID=1279 RepID=UPI00085BBE99|nr:MULTISPECIES: hypothetical protein [Staphylococcus]MCS5431217.1 hypothetical protein [Staphylococcus aureus]
MKFSYGKIRLSKGLLLFGRNETGKSTIEKYKGSNESNNELVIEYLNETINKTKILTFIEKDKLRNK